MLETGFVVSALEQSDTDHDACSEFLERLIRARRTLFYNDLFELELHQAAFDLAALEVQVRPRPTDAVVRFTDPDVRDLAGALLRRWHAVVMRADTVHVDAPNLLEDVRYFMERHGLSAAHAVQAGLVVASGADGIATVDDRFAMVDETLLRVYTPRRLVSASRSRRPPAWRRT
ncbi:hypothetical protein ACLBWP_05575 [Microbacterium sp. M1A1_1b]